MFQYERPGRSIAFFLAACLLIVLATSIGSCVMYKANDSVIEITVKDKERIERHGYLVYTQEGEVFEITDTLAYMRFDSAETYGALTPDKKYKVKVAGWRVPLLGLYRNIINSEEIE